MKCTLTLHSIDNDDLEGDINRNALRTRTAFIISPDNRFRMIFNYPAAVGMNIAELLRSIECLKIAREIDGLVSSSSLPT
jgi:alkyl hydroperoxide reductase subunit AhpC